MRRQIPRRRLDGEIPTGLIIDARSESEYHDDHIPGAINLPTLNDAERIEVGTLYKQVSPFHARIRGATLAARNIANHVESSLAHLDSGSPMWVYCWRGGQRSGSLALVLNEIGFQPTLINGGYKHWRHEVMQGIPEQVARLKWRVLSGPTGSGKTKWLKQLADAGENVIDLEGLGAHRGSLLGDVEGGQPSQRMFESRLYHALCQLNPDRSVWVESESANLGKLTIPPQLMEQIHTAQRVQLNPSISDRVAFLLQDYEHWQTHTQTLIEQLNRLRMRHSNARVDQWVAWIQDGQFAELVEDLLTQHYDPTYQHGMRRLNQDRVVHLDLSPSQDGLDQLLALSK